MELGEWKRRFAPRILRRGEDVFYAGAVRSLAWDGGTIAAVVAGTDDYAVEIAVSGGQTNTMVCSCPYARREHCKHMAAALFAASDDAFPGPETVTEAQVRAWTRQIIRLTVRYSDRNGRMEARNADAYVTALEALLDEKVPVLLDGGLPMGAFALIRRALTEAAELDPSGGGPERLGRTCAKHWRAVLPRLNGEERRRACGWFKENAARWPALEFQKPSGKER